MNIKALLKKIEKTNEVMYIKCDFNANLIGVVFDRCMIYWIDRKFVNPPITIAETTMDFMDYTCVESIVKYTFNSKLISAHSLDDKRRNVLLLDNRVVVNKKLLKYIDISKVWFYIEETDAAFCKPVHIYEKDRLIATVMPMRFKKEQIEVWADKIERIL